MRIIALIVIASIALSGCALLEVGALEGAGVGIAAEAGGGAAVAATDFTLSGDLVEATGRALNSGTGEATLSNAFSDLTEGGQRTAQLNMNSQGIISARGQPLAYLDANGDLSYSGQKVGFVNATDTRLYEVLNDGSTRPIAVLRGFVTRNGVQLLSTTDGTVVRILRSDVVMDVVAVRNGQYLVRLANGQEALVPASMVDSLALLGLGQVVLACPPDDHEGEAVRRSGEGVRFKHCEKRKGAYWLSGDTGDTVVDAHDITEILTGGGIPGVQDGGAQSRLLTEAQSTANTIGAPPGEQAMNMLATVAYVPALEVGRAQFHEHELARERVQLGIQRPTQQLGGERFGLAEERHEAAAAPALQRLPQQSGGDRFRLAEERHEAAVAPTFQPPQLQAPQFRPPPFQSPQNQLQFQQRTDAAGFISQQPVRQTNRDQSLLFPSRQAPMPARPPIGLTPAPRRPGPQDRR